ncbi:MAG TPA: hypothetical protein VOB72_01300 [Candidatus Dormibacteraeota bacterium]|nr:hypothetical protein [Candidatus Dormibacteraeota bacterium]
MAGPGMRLSGPGASGGVDFGRSTQDQVPGFIGLIRILHSEPTASAFGRLLRKELQPEDYVQLAHLFEEISALALHRHIAEELLFDAFAFDMYWDELREDVLAVRRMAGNDKFCENFEIAAERARRYRQDFPPKLRWQRRDRPGDPPTDQPPGGGGGGGGGLGRGPSPPPQPSPTVSEEVRSS